MINWILRNKFQGNAINTFHSRKLIKKCLLPFCSGLSEFTFYDVYTWILTYKNEEDIQTNTDVKIVIKTKQLLCQKNNVIQGNGENVMIISNAACKCNTRCEHKWWQSTSALVTIFHQLGMEIQKVCSTYHVETILATRSPKSTQWRWKQQGSRTSLHKCVCRWASTFSVSSGNPVYRWTDRQTDGQMARRTWWIQYTTHPSLAEGGYNKGYNVY